MDSSPSKSSERPYLLAVAVVLIVAIPAVIGVAILLARLKSANEVERVRVEQERVAQIEADRLAQLDAERLTPMLEGQWRPLVDSANRFRCSIPAGCDVETVEAGERSKVRVVFDESCDLMIIVRTTNVAEIREEDLAEIGRNQLKLLRDFGGSPSIVKSRLSEVDGCVSADITIKVDSLRRVKDAEKLQMRLVKFKRHGLDHTVSLSASPAAFSTLNPHFDKLLASYRSIAANSVGPKSGDAVNRRDSP